MNTYVPTIEELNRQPKSELCAMFRHAASVAASAQRPAQERAAAQKALENIQRCLAAKAFRP